MDDKRVPASHHSRKKKIHIIQKESALTAIYASGNLTASQKKVFNAFLYIGKNFINSNIQGVEDGITVPVAMLKNIIGDKSNNYTFLKKTVESLQDFTVETNVLGKDKQVWDRFSLVAGATIKDGMLTYSFPHQIVEALKNPKMYVTLDLDEINRIERKHAISLYEIIEDFKKLPNLPKWSIDDFRRALDIPEDRYKSFRDLHRRVIAPAVKEINEKFGMGLEYILYSNLLAIHSREIDPETGGLAENGQEMMSKRKRLPRITHIQFVLTKEKAQQRMEYKQFIQDMRQQYKPLPEEGHFPVIETLDGKELRLDATGRLYFSIVGEHGMEIEELTPEKSDRLWKELWKKYLNGSKKELGARK
ncbi:replication initiation protein [Hydrogenimonas cancrithermarum]|uniref:Initiator Rep protein WH1 domain-containing protein n=1 Tax=Hydrogenimonas cancrithermarum TaxID=2993563 RepID=A0ABM8FNJ5_9BACT|nr:replication initiation protein [Hydrogenimonas cancrithermarum]BDY13970.1 hypothetical protein HCR_22830 [Hydrogenimonas cancrithermarum]